MTLWLDPLTACCEICERKISLVAEWVPHRDGIRHFLCEPEEDA